MEKRSERANNEKKRKDWQKEVEKNIYDVRTKETNYSIPRRKKKSSKPTPPALTSLVRPGTPAGRILILRESPFLSDGEMVTLGSFLASSLGLFWLLLNCG